MEGLIEGLLLGIIIIMHVTYGSVYYFTLLTMFMTLGLAVFWIRKVRKCMLDWVQGYRVGDSQLMQSFLYISFSVIVVIMVDSIWTYFSVCEDAPTISPEFSLNTEHIKYHQHQ